MTDALDRLARPTRTTWPAQLQLPGQAAAPDGAVDLTPMFVMHHGFRRDLRLADNPALQAALAAGYAPIPVYVHAPHEDAPWLPGAATQAWLHLSLLALDADLQARGSRLVIREGDSLEH